MDEQEARSKSTTDKTSLPSRSTPHPLAAVQPHPLHSRHPPPTLIVEVLLFSNATHARRRRNTIQNYPSPPSPPPFLLDLQFFRHHPPCLGSTTPRSLTQPRPYLASLTPHDSHAAADGALAFPRSAFLSQTVSSLCWPSSHEIRTSDSDGC